MEVILVSGRDGEKDGSLLNVIDLHTGSHIHTFRNNNSASRAAICLNQFLLVAQHDKATVNLYRWHKEAIDQQLILPEKLCKVVASHDQKWLLGGSANGRLYLWELESGNLIFVREAHYQEITNLIFSGDDLAFISASSDAQIRIWSMADVLTLTTPTAVDLVNPVRTLQGHTQQISDLYVSVGSYLSARLYSASLDCSLRVWDLATGNLISIILFPSPITCMRVDPAERCIHAGTVSGAVFAHKMYKEAKDIHTIGSDGTIVEVSQAGSDVLEGHAVSVLSMCSSLDGSLLITGAQDGSTFVWSIASGQLVRSLKQQYGPVTILATALRNHLVVTRGKSSQIPALKRVLTQRRRDATYVMRTLKADLDRSLYQPKSDTEAVQSGLGSFVQAALNFTSHKTIHDLQAEVSRLRAAHDELTDVHERLKQDFIISRI